jgi:hypothetical protein
MKYYFNIFINKNILKYNIYHGEQPGKTICMHVKNNITKFLFGKQPCLLQAPRQRRTNVGEEERYKSVYIKNRTQHYNYPKS